MGCGRGGDLPGWDNALIRHLSHRGNHWILVIHARCLKCVFPSGSDSGQTCLGPAYVLMVCLGHDGNGESEVWNLGWMVCIGCAGGVDVGGTGKVQGRFLSLAGMELVRNWPGCMGPT